MKEFHLDIVTPDCPVFSGEIQSLLIKTKEGDVEILASHVDYLAALGTGRARIIMKDSTRRYGAVSEGFLTVSNGSAKLVCITFEWGESIDIARARLAKEKAEQVLKNSKNDKELALAKAKLMRALSRINVHETLND